MSCTLAGGDAVTQASSAARAFGEGFVDELPGVTVGAITPAAAVGR